MTRAGRGCLSRPQSGSLTHLLAPRAGSSMHRSPASAAHTALLQGQMHLLRGRQLGTVSWAQQLPRARRPVCLALPGRESHTLAEALSHGGPDRGGWGAHGWGTVVC
ncbi:Hypothetical protein GSB_152843 [Giardia duodenalis]|uniref:Uncharacterized protein n=1 Tax=Giardia intestinalis TaxID=5741 RepID=V6TVK2_GIAIN|nr:Hypothetical protein GSB_152843 [Giardia intestinalis]